jgi:hypothetical protein
LTEQQGEHCLQEIIANERWSTKKQIVGFSQSFHIMKWRIRSEEVPTSSTITLHYGSTRHISTFLLFETFEQFKYVASVFEEIGLCTLDKRYLKEMKRGASRRK